MATGIPALSDTPFPDSHLSIVCLYLRCVHITRTLTHDAHSLLDDPAVIRVHFQFPNAVCVEL